MSRNKIILAVALVLSLVLGFAFLAQVRKLQRQLRSSVRILPEDSKSRQDLTEGVFSQDAVPAGRPEVLVKFRGGVSHEVISEVTSRFNDRIQDEIEAVPGLTVIDDPDDAKAEALVAQYQALPEVEYAEPNYEITLDQSANGELHANDPRLGEQWWLTHVGAMQAWARTKGSAEIVVGVLDSGVDYSHPDLVNNMWKRPTNVAPYQDRDLGTIDDYHGYNAIANDGDPFDDNGHGTNCAGIIGAECGNKIGICGVNWKIAIMPLRFINAGGFGSVADAIEAINYAIERKHAGVNLRIINASWGLSQRSRALADTIRKTNEVGILVVAASGSSGNNNDATSHFPASYNLENILTVAAVDKGDGLAQFSNYGAKSVHLAAPGRDILTTALGNDFALRSGSSLAAPIVTGVAALVLSARPGLSVTQLRSVLLDSVDKVPGLHGKITSGGRVNAARAINQNRAR